MIIFICIYFFMAKSVGLNCIEKAARQYLFTIKSPQLDWAVIKYNHKLAFATIIQ